MARASELCGRRYGPPGGITMGFLRVMPHLMYVDVRATYMTQDMRLHLPYFMLDSPRDAEENRVLAVEV